MAKKLESERIEKLKKTYPHLGVFKQADDPLLASDWLNPFLYYEERERLNELSLAGRLDAILSEVDKSLLMAEDLVLTSVVRPGINIAYYNNWCREANLTFTLAVRLKRRAEAVKLETQDLAKNENSAKKKSDKS